ncbi:MAG TPA: hypothetical protein VME41_08380 [Stellaceae bacterium]|nr:hypothetical protein [Stellaceae bacterium]
MISPGADLVDMEFAPLLPIGHPAPRLVGIEPIMWDPMRDLVAEMRSPRERLKYSQSGTAEPVL